MFFRVGDFFVFIMFCVGLFYTDYSLAGQNPEVPESIVGVTVVNSEQMLEFMEYGKVLLIDARKPADFTFGTIPGSTHCQVVSGSPSFADDQVQLSVKDFRGCKRVREADRQQKVAVFCNGINCWRSGKGAYALKKMGFVNVLWYRIGMNNWKSQGLPLE
ncbi:MAG: rhodanese-like domain-containing protein [Magnetococcales bacterium]|nr:rhodanese-like domain-containing protein [Magnetococcales bacterium]